jgi:hypothetical protein
VIRRKAKSKADPEARAALIESEKLLVQAHRQSREAKRLHESLHGMASRNHFAENLTLVFFGDGHEIR